MKVLEQEKEKIRKRYTEYRNKSMSKQAARQAVAKEFGRGISTIFDHVYDLDAVPTAEYGDVKPASAKILIWDIETAPNLGYVWGKYDQNVIEFVDEWYMLGWSAKWYGSDEVITRCLADYRGDKPLSQDDSRLVKELHSLISQADITVAHNGDKFDIRRANTRFLLNDLPPPHPSRSVDTLKVAKKYFSFNSNRLDDLGQVLGVGRKVKHDGFELWKGFIMRDPECIEKMKAYNTQDVLLLEKVYTKMRAWITNHPHVGLMSNMTVACSVCAGKDLVKRGFHYTSTGRSPRYQCKNCNHYGTGKWERMTYVK